MHHDDGGLPLDPDLDPTDPAQPRPGRRPLGRGALAERRAGRARPAVLGAVAVGGAVGAAARHAVADVVPSGAAGFPWATFATNLAGSFLLGLLLVIAVGRSPRDGLLRPFAATGVLGAFTTMSTYQLETALLARDGHLATAAVYAVCSPLAGLTLAYAGIAAARRAVGTA